MVGDVGEGRGDLGVLYSQNQFLRCDWEGQQCAPMLYDARHIGHEWIVRIGLMACTVLMTHSVQKICPSGNE